MKALFNQDFTLPKINYDCLIIEKGKSKITRDCGGLTIEQPIFSTTEHCQFLASIPHIYMAPGSLGSSGSKSSREIDLNFSSIVSARQNISLESIQPELIARIRNIKEDPRLACSAIVAVDEIYGMKYMFLLTDDMIYALYGRDRDSECDNKNLGSLVKSAAFTSLIPLLKRTTTNTLQIEGRLGDLIKLTLCFKSGNCVKNSSVSWLIDDEEVLKISNLGCRLDDKYQVLDHGGTNKKVGIGRLKFSFGHYSFLDFQLPNNYAREMIKKDETGMFPVYRSASGLVMLNSVEEYREPLPDFTGSYPRIVPSLSFAIIDKKNCKLARGMSTKIKSFNISLEEKTLDESDLKLKDLEIETESVYFQEVSGRDEGKSMLLTLFPTDSSSESLAMVEAICRPEVKGDSELSSVGGSQEKGPCPFDKNPIFYHGEKDRSNQDIKDDKRYMVLESAGSSGVVNSGSVQSGESTESGSAGSVYRRISRKKMNRNSDTCNTESHSLSPLTNSKCWICKSECLGFCCDRRCGSDACSGQKKV